MEREKNNINDSKKRKEPKTLGRENGFSDWGGYMAAKRAKLMDQFKDSEIPKLTNIFEGVAIHVNGLTRPPSDELKNLMAAHGGEFHMYQVSSTTHIIASNLPNVKIKHIGTTPVVKPSWITESINFGKLLDYRRYLLYTNQSKTQPRIDFPIIEKPTIENSGELGKNLVQDQNSSNVPPVNGSLVPISSNVSSDHTSRYPTKTASDPNFLEEFYNNSRLHLISTLGAEFKQLVSQMRDKSDGKFPGKEKLLQLKVDRNPTFSSTSVIMHIDMDCFFVSVSLRNHPELKGEPVAITHARNGQLSNVKPDQRANREREFSLYSERLPTGVASRLDKIDSQASMSEIASCSYEARRCGIKNGMFLGQAVKMCPELKTLPYDFEGIKAVSRTLYETVASYTLDIEAVSCDEMYVDVTKVLRVTGLSVEEWATHIRNEIMNVTGCPCSTGFGANRLQARLATKKAKPAGQYYLKSENVEAYMVEVPLADLPGVGRATLSKLHKMGLHTCGDLQLASLRILQAEIGHKAGETLKEQAVGVDNRPLNFYQERKSVSAEVNYGIRFQTIEVCYNFLQNLSTEVYNRINEIGMRSRCLTLKLMVRAPEAPVETAKFLGHGVCDSLTKSSASNTILNDPQIIFKEAKTLYDKLNPQFTDLRGVGLQLTKLEKNAPLNTALSKFLKKKDGGNDENRGKIDEGLEMQMKSDENREKIDKSGVMQKTDGNLEKNDERREIQRKSVGNREKIGGSRDTQRKSDDNDEAEKKGDKQKSFATSNRGRPKGSKNNVTKSTKTTRKSGNINNYFGKTKNTENRSKSNKVDAKIDMDVLNELPDDLRREIMREYNIHEKIERQTIRSQKCEDKVQNRRKSEKGNVRKSPFSDLSWEQIKPIIKKWIESDEDPIDFDVEMIAEHFKRLAIDRKIETLFGIFNFLHRIFSGLSCSWHEAYFKMVNITQEGMVARYGGTLLVKRQFDCCKM